MNVRAFAVVTGPDGMTAETPAREHENFGWNLSRECVIDFMDKFPKGDYAILLRGKP